jgi:hypothetical protein
MGMVANGGRFERPRAQEAGQRLEESNRWEVWSTSNLGQPVSRSTSSNQRWPRSRNKVLGDAKMKSISISNWPMEGHSRPRRRDCVDNSITKKLYSEMISDGKGRT